MSEGTKPTNSGEQSQRPPCICFDATGTLIEVAESVGEVYRRAALDQGVDLPAWRLDDAFRRVLRHAPPLGVEGADEEERRRGEVAWWSERIRQTFQATDSTVRFRDFQALATQLFDAFRAPQTWRVRPGMLELLQTLEQRGARLCVVSNFDHRLPILLEGIGLADFFCSVEIPSKHGQAKPSRVPFEAAAQAIGCPVEALSYVGDDDAEVLDAIRAIGIRAFGISDGDDLAALADRLCVAATLPADPKTPGMPGHPTDSDP